MLKRLALLALILIAPPALPTLRSAVGQSSADQTLPAVLDGEIGWGGWIRQGRWNLARADVQSGSPMEADFEWYVPQIGRRSMRIALEVVLNPRPRTIQALLPVGPAPLAIYLEVRSRTTGRLLGHWQDPEPATLPERLVPENTVYIAVAGQGAAVSALDDPRLTIGIDRERHLPSAPVGFDAFDVVLLDRVNLEALSTTQQQALVDWVRIGGRVLVQLDVSLLPESSPLLDVLPTRPRRLTDTDGSTRVVIDEADQGPLSIVAVGEGLLGILQVDLERLPTLGRADLLHQFGQRERRPSTPAGSSDEPFETPGGRRTAVLLIFLAVVVGPVDALLARLGGRRLRRWTLLPAVILGLGGVALLVASGGTPENRIPALEGVTPPAVVEAAGSPGAIAAAMKEAGQGNARQWWRLGGAPRDAGPLIDIDFRQTPRVNLPASDAPAPYRIDLR